MPIVVVLCPDDGAPLEVSLELRAAGFALATSPGFVEHMNAEHGGQMRPVEVWPPAEP